MNNNKFIIIYCTFPNREEATDIGTKLLNQRLIACANYAQIEGLFFWEGKISNGPEISASFKTRRENWEKVKEFIEKNHSYEIPGIIKYDVEANSSYIEWVYNETKS